MVGNGEEGKNEAAPPLKSADPVSSSKGCIRVNSNPPGADILLNGKTTGKQTPATLDDLDPGSYTIGVTMEGCPAVSRDVKVTTGSTTTVNFTLMTAKNEGRIKIIVTWTFAIFVLAVVIAILNRFALLPVTDNLTKLIIYCACAGAIGGTTFSIYEVVSHLGIGDFDVAYFWWYIARPFIGLVYGTMILLFVAGGLMTLSGVSAPLSPGLFDQKSVMFYIALSFLAGYAEEPVSLELKDLAEAIFKKPDRPDSQNGHN
jgi:hypothetical protein